MPKFIIPAGIKLQNKADMALIVTLGKIIDAGNQGLYHSEHGDYRWDREDGIGTLKAFRLIEQRTKIKPARKNFKKNLNAIPKLTKALAGVKPTDIDAFGEAIRKLEEATNWARNDRPRLTYYYVATAKGKKLYDDIQISLSGD